MGVLPYYHVDVFTDRPFSGNGLTVFTEAGGLSKVAMLGLTKEMRQFESIFLERVDSNTVRAYIFTCHEATGSLARPAGAYLVKKGFQKPGTLIQLQQGENLGRPSQLFVEVTMTDGELADTFVSGDVYKVAQGVVVAGDHLAY